MSRKIPLAIVGLGRMGLFHAQHVLELSAAGGACELVAVVDPDEQRTARFAQELAKENGQRLAVFRHVSDLVRDTVVECAVVASSTDTHESSAQELIDAGCRVLVEKPLTSSLESARSFAARLNRDNPHALMLAYQRRFDAPLLYVKELLAQERIGRPFKMISILEDSGPPPDGYQSPGLLTDMAVHNVDEVLWLLDAYPTNVQGTGSNVYNYKNSTAEEDFDEAFLQMWFAKDLVAQVHIGRNHIVGYHVETSVYGERGMIRVGSFQPDPRQVAVELHQPGGNLEEKAFVMPDYPDDVPEFIQRFGPAYKAELAYFVQQCAQGEPFAVNHNDGVRAMEIIAAGSSATATREASPSVRQP